LFKQDFGSIIDTLQRKIGPTKRIFL